ncbi:NADH-flavin reductase [Campylobacter sp. MIT 99-7217]|uniref:NAD(P)-dependent oxidoreductase n=1 Tax=Campylobacter sp. MIT 99-7217 TaxID=535091 RepID=UPI00115B2C02|nr:NAD(P)H-binding protein [Campylobacter sp. MIT 99-7217]TQR32457.1 NADH-flavin reductase [Campylobacter sp. MIT 99-7217]
MKRFLAWFLCFVCVHFAFAAEKAGANKKIAVLSANGRLGSLIVEEALARKLSVVAFVRDSSQRVPKNATIIKKDIFDLQKEDLKDFDVIISAFGASDAKSFERYYSKLASLFKDTNKKLIVVGGAGSLYMDKKHSLMLQDTPDFPPAYKVVAKAHADGLAFLRKQDFDFTYVSPPADFVYEAKKSGKYTLGGDEFFVNSKGESKGSYADIAVAIIDLALKGGYKKQRVSIVAE